MQIILSPAKEYTRNFNIDDWQRLWLDFVKELDGMEQFIKRDKSGKDKYGRTNIAESKHTVWLHLESKGQTPHLHAAICRIDKNGNINDDHYIGRRVQKAAANVAKARGWKTAIEVHEDRLLRVTKDCMDVLNEMDIFSLKDYFARLEHRGYEVVVRPDKQGIIHGYSLVRNNCNYKASELGKGRKLTVKNLKKTWEKLYGERDQTREIQARNDYYKYLYQEEEKKNEAGSDVPKLKPDYKIRTEGTTSYTFRDNLSDHIYYIPEEVAEFFDEEFDYREIANWRDLTDFAIQLFVGYLDAATTVTPSGGGGGEQSGLPWRDRDKDEDEMAFARRCAEMARNMCGVIPKSGYRRRR